MPAVGLETTRSSSLNPHTTTWLPKALQDRIEWTNLKKKTTIYSRWLQTKRDSIRSGHKKNEKRKPSLFDPSFWLFPTVSPVIIPRNGREWNKKNNAPRATVENLINAPRQTASYVHCLEGNKSCKKALKLQVMRRQRIRCMSFFVSLIQASARLLQEENFLF